MPPSWDPLSLAFSDKELESQCSKYSTALIFSRADREFVSILHPTTWFLVFGILSGSLPVSFYTQTMVYYICGILTVGLQRNCTAWFLKHRTLIILLLRTLHLRVLFYVATLLPREKPVLLQFLSIQAAAIFLIYWTISMPIIFQVHIKPTPQIFDSVSSVQLHVMYHSAALTFIFLHLQQTLCGYELTLWQTAFRMLRLNYESGLQEVEQCRRVILFILFAAGFAVPTNMLWLIELISRIRYMEEMHIPIVGSISVAYMTILLLCSCVSVWVLLFFVL